MSYNATAACSAFEVEYEFSNNPTLNYSCSLAEQHTSLLLFFNLMEGNIAQRIRRNMFVRN